MTPRIAERRAHACGARGGAALLPAAFVTLLLTVAALWLLAPATALAATSADQQRLDDYVVIADGNQKTAPVTDGEDATLVAQVDARPSNLAVCGDAVAWQLGDGANGAVWLGDLESDDPTCLSEHGVEPALSGYYVVWVDFVNDAAGDILAATIDNPQMPATVCASAGAQRSPAAADNLVVWQDQRAGGWDIYGSYLNGAGDWLDGPTAVPRCWDDDVLAPSAAFPFCTADGDQTQPAAWGGVVAWTDARGQDKDIWAIAHYVKSLMAALSLRQCRAAPGRSTRWPCARAPGTRCILPWPTAPCSGRTRPAAPATAMWPATTWSRVTASWSPTPAARRPCPRPASRP